MLRVSVAQTTCLHAFFKKGKNFLQKDAVTLWPPLCLITNFNSFFFCSGVEEGGLPREPKYSSPLHSGFSLFFLMILFPSTRS